MNVRVDQCNERVVLIYVCDEDDGVNPVNAIELSVIEIKGPGQDTQLRVELRQGNALELSEDDENDDLTIFTKLLEKR